MPRLKYKLPSYFQHKASGQAVAKIDGQIHYLGKFASQESLAAYHRLLAERSVGGPRYLAPRTDLRINELLVKYLEFAAGYYVKSGRPTGEFANMRDAIKPLRLLYETTPVAEFGPTALRAVREKMIEVGLSRKVVNARINRIRRIFKWGVERELIGPGVLQGLQSVAPLKQGRSDAPETGRVMPVHQAHVDAVAARVTRPVSGCSYK